MWIKTQVTCIPDWFLYAMDHFILLDLVMEFCEVPYKVIVKAADLLCEGDLVGQVHPGQQPTTAGAWITACGRQMDNIEHVTLESMTLGYAEDPAWLTG